MTDGYDLTVLNQRSRHDGGLIWDMVRHGLRQVRKCLRVSCDARLWNGLTYEQQAAMEQIALAYSVITNGVGMRAFDPSRVAGSTAGDADRVAVLTAHYFAWAKAVQKAKHDHAMALDVIVFGHGLQDIDRNRRQRKGTARANLVECLDLWQ